MERKINLNKIQWIHKPKLCFTREDCITMETEPFTHWRDTTNMKLCAMCTIPVHDNFIFTVCTEYHYECQFDQCGFLLQSGDDTKVVFGTQKKDDECISLSSIVFYNEGGDRSERNIGTGLHKLYYRIWYRAGSCRIQYSFSGERYNDLRVFPIDENIGIQAIHMYACSPKNSSFDCSFQNVQLLEQEL